MSTTKFKITVENKFEDSNMRINIKQFSKDTTGIEPESSQTGLSLSGRLKFRKHHFKGRGPADNYPAYGQEPTEPPTPVRQESIGCGDNSTLLMSSPKDVLTLRLYSHREKRTKAHWIELPQSAFYSFDPSDNTGITVSRQNGRVKLTIPEGQTPNWELQIMKPKLSSTTGEDGGETGGDGTNNDNVSVGDDGDGG